MRALELLDDNVEAPALLERLGGLKGFADGSPGSTTACFLEPYTDDPANRGLLADEMLPIEGMRDRLRQGDRAGLQWSASRWRSGRRQ